MTPRVPAPESMPVLSRGKHRNSRRGACFMEMASFLAVTADQIQAVARKYLVPERRFVLDIVPAPKTEKPNK